MSNARLPAIFLSHGSPMLAVEDSPAGHFLDGLGDALPRPRAVVVASAHFMTDAPTVGSDAAPRTVHDFGGFPAALYQLQYPAAGQPDLAQQIAERMQAAGAAVRIRPQQGLDHGVWVPLRRMYPQADIPVVPLSVMPHRSAAEHYAIGQALAGLRDDGVLLIGSGGFVHNLGELDRGVDSAPMPAWAREFRDWMRAKIAGRDIDALLDWQAQAPHARRAHPSVEHLMPLFVALGAAGEDFRVRHLHDSHQYGSLALDAFAFD